PTSTVNFHNDVHRVSFFGSFDCHRRHPPPTKLAWCPHAPQQTKSTARDDLLDHLVGAQTRTFLIRLLLAVVPDIGRELPVASDLLPHHEIFARDFFRHRTLGLEAEGPDLSRRRRSEWLDVEGCEFRIADLLRHAFPQCLDRGSALHHAGT